MAPEKVVDFSYDRVPLKELAKFHGPFNALNIYNAAMLGMIERVNAVAPGIYIPCRCPEGARFAYLMQDLLFSQPHQLLESLVLGAGLGALGGAALGAVHGFGTSDTTAGKVKSALSGGLAGSALGSLLTTFPSNMNLIGSAQEYFGPWSGHGLERFLDSVDYGVQNVAGMALLYPLFMAFTVAWPLIYILYKSCRSIAPAIKEAEKLASILKEDGAI